MPSRLVSQAAISSLPLVGVSAFKSIREGLQTLSFLKAAPIEAHIF